MILYMDISDDLVLSQVKVTVPTAPTFWYFLFFSFLFFSLFFNVHLGV